MIKIKNLTKIYKSKKRKRHTALCDISLTLPDSGLIFVLGKSGSGKSTLLNLIGGLDNITSGSIIVDGNNLADFSEQDFCDYRNNYLGFIFQDYHLIDDLTVRENIRLALDLRRVEDPDGLAIDRALERVDLAGYGDRYPTELSGGERQRVAIARAIVKKPRIILADEPTGNLDTDTAASIIDLLGELSKECLILVVSHNVSDATRCADRIIRLSCGNIILDCTRNPEFGDSMRLDTDTIVYPEGTALSPEDIEILNQNPHRKVVTRSDKFVPTEQAEPDTHRAEINRVSLSFARDMFYSGRFLKQKVPAIIFAAIVTSLIVVVLALIRTITTFDTGRIMMSELNNLDITSLSVFKTTAEDSSPTLDGTVTKVFGEITDEEIRLFEQAGYTDAIHKVYNYYLPFEKSPTGAFAGFQTTTLSTMPYPITSLGVLCVDEEFLQRKIGKFELVAEAQELNPGGVYITDYIADRILTSNSVYYGKTYNDLLGGFKVSVGTGDRGYINGIIATDYKEKHAVLLESINSIDKTSLITNQDYMAFNNDVHSYLGYCYSFEPDYKDAFARGWPTDFTWHHLVYLDEHRYDSRQSPKIWPISRFVEEYKLGDTMKLEGNEVIMYYDRYNKMFGTNYELLGLDEFEPHTARFRQYHLYDVQMEDPLVDIEIEIKALHRPTSAYTLIVSDQLYSQIVDNCVFVSGLYFDSNRNMDTVIDVCEQLGFSYTTGTVEAVNLTMEYIEVYIPIFELIVLFIYAAIVFILINFATRMISDKMHEIGILKALGTKNRSIIVIFGLQIALIVLLTCAISTLGYYYFVDVFNDILVQSLKEYAKKWAIADPAFLAFMPHIAVTNCVTVLLLSVVSMIIPMIKIKAIKPVKIIKTKE